MLPQAAKIRPLVDRGIGPAILRPFLVTPAQPVTPAGPQFVVSVVALPQRDRTKLRCATVLGRSGLSHTWRISDIDEGSHCRIMPPAEGSREGVIEVTATDGHHILVELDWPLTGETVVRALNQAGSHVRADVPTNANPRRSWVSGLLDRTRERPAGDGRNGGSDRTGVLAILKRFGLRREKVPLNVLFVGPPASGKTTAIMVTSDMPARTTEASPTDDVATLKARTTISMDYGECAVGGYQVRMFGTPGQLRFAHMIANTRRSADAAILLLDVSSPDPLGDLLQYRDHVREFDTCGGRPLLVGLTHTDRKPVDEHFRDAVTAAIGRRVPVMKLDPRRKADVVQALSALAGMVPRPALAEAG